PKADMRGQPEKRGAPRGRGRGGTRLSPNPHAAQWSDPVDPGFLGVGSAAGWARPDSRRKPGSNKKQEEAEIMRMRHGAVLVALAGLLSQATPAWASHCGAGSYGSWGEPCLGAPGNFPNLHQQVQPTYQPGHHHGT